MEGDKILAAIAAKLDSPSSDTGNARLWRAKLDLSKSHGQALGALKKRNHRHPEEYSKAALAKDREAIYVLSRAEYYKSRPAAELLQTEKNWCERWDSLKTRKQTKAEIDADYINALIKSQIDAIQGLPSGILVYPKHGGTGNKKVAKAQLTWLLIAYYLRGGKIQIIPTANTQPLINRRISVRPAHTAVAWSTNEKKTGLSLQFPAPIHENQGDRPKRIHYDHPYDQERPTRLETQANDNHRLHRESLEGLPSKLRKALEEAWEDHSHLWDKAASLCPSFLNTV